MFEKEDIKYTPIKMGDHELKSELDTGLYDNLRKLNIELSTYIVNEHPIKLIIVGGDEVIHRSDLKESSETYKSNLSGSIKKGGVIGERGLLPFIYTNVELRARHISDLVNYKDVDNLNKEQLQKFIRDTDYKYSYDLNKTLNNKNCKVEKIGSNDDIVGSVEAVQDWTALKLNIPFIKDLEDNIVHIYEANPSTNSIALAKQFRIEHKHVIRDLFKLCQSKPSLLMGIAFQPYQYINGEYKIITYATYLEVNEDVYYYFLQSMGTPKSKGMKVYRQKKMDEYFKAFNILREDMYIKGYKEQELKRIIHNRTQFTSILKGTIKDYSIHRNIGSLATNSITFDEYCIIFFNLINYSCGIDATDHSGNKSNRNELSIALQEDIKYKEVELNNSLKIVKGLSVSLLDSLAITFDTSEHRLGEWLRSYDRGELWDKLSNNYKVNTDKPDVVIEADK